MGGPGGGGAALTRPGSIAAAPATEAAAEATGEPTRGPEGCGREQPPRAAPHSRGSGGRLALR